MNVVRSLERRLERLFEGVTGKVFSGRLHPTEIAGKLAREADFARFEHETGPATANVYTIAVNPRDLSLDPDELERTLVAEIDSYTRDEGLRLEGPVKVDITSSYDISPGTVLCHVEVRPGPTVPWARLVADNETVDIGRIRASIGRETDVDVILAHEDVSRRHALIWTQGGQVIVRDLGSSNGTTVDGAPVTNDQVVQAGSVLGFAAHRYRLVLL